MSGKLRDMVSPANIAHFREHFFIPADVGIELLPKNAKPRDFDVTDGVVFPLIAFPEGGLRFPLTPLFRQAFSFWGLCPHQFIKNFYRVISGMEALNRALGLRLGFSAVRHCYMLSPFSAKNHKRY